MNNEKDVVNAAQRPWNSLDEQALIRLCQRQLPGDTSGFEELVARLQPGIYRHAMGYLRNPDDAWEVTQEVLLRLFHNLGRFEGRSAFSSWLYRIVENQCHTFVQGRRRRVMSDHLSALILIHEEGLRHQDEERGDSELVRVVVEGLPASAREVLNLRFVHDLSLDEIAQGLGISLSAAKMRLYRSLESFRVQYSGLMAA